MRLDEFPADLLLGVFCFLKPLDIIAIRQTCRYIYVLTLGRSVWVTAMKRTMYDEQMYLKTHDPESMTRIQLEEASTTPSRFMRKLLAGCPVADPNPPLLRYSSMRLIERITLTRDPESPIKDLCTFRTQFIPGGRFMLTISPIFGDPDSAIIRVLDLDMVRMAGFQVYAQWTYHDGVVFAPRQSDDGKELMVAMSRVVKDLSEFSVFRVIDEGDRPPRIVTHTTSPLVYMPMPHRDFPIFTFTNDFFIYLDERPRQSPISDQEYKRSGEFHVVIWNFRDDTAVVWQLADFWYREVLVDQGHIILLCDEGLIGWKIPQLYTMEGSLFRLDDYPLSFIHGYDLDGGVAKDYIRMADWYHPDQGSWPFDTVYLNRYHQAFTQIDKHYAIIPAPLKSPTTTASSSITIDPHLSPLSRVICRTETSRYPGEKAYRGYFGRPGADIMISQNRTVKLLHESKKIYVCTAPLGVEEKTLSEDGMENTPQNFITQLEIPAQIPPYIPGNHAERWVSFDAASGRLAYIGINSPAIVLLDYMVKR